MPHQDLDKNLAIILNPVSGKHDIISWSKRLGQSLDENKMSFCFYETEKQGHARDLAQALANEGWKYILSVGGDGTNTESIQGIMESQGDPTYAHIPKGSGNDWATFHNLSTDIKQIVQSLCQPKFKMIDVCEVSEGENVSYYCNILGCGFDTQVVRYINDYIKRKRPWTYKLAIIQNIFKYKPLKFNLTIDGQIMSLPLYSGHFGIGRQSGGGQIILPHAGNDQSGIAYTLVFPTSKVKLLMATKSLSNGQIRELPFVKTGHAQEIKIEGMDHNSFEADGEILQLKSIIIKRKTKAIRLLDTSLA